MDLPMELDFPKTALRGCRESPDLISSVGRVVRRDSSSVYEPVGLGEEFGVAQEKNCPVYHRGLICEIHSTCNTPFAGVEPCGEP
jgi:hypothetical protein